MGYTDEEVVGGVKENPKFIEEVVRPKMCSLCEDTIDMLLIDDIKTSQGITEETRSVVLRAFTRFEDQSTSDRSTERPATRRPRRPAR